MQRGFAYAAAYTLTPGQPPPGLGYLPASPHRSTTTHQDPNTRTSDPKASPVSVEVSTVRFVVGAALRVREYQPVVHRLRLSASP